MGILDVWIDDLPQQFQGKQFIEALLSAFSKQIEELYGTFKQLGTETDLESAVGKNLDMVGNIVSLTRKEAGLLAGIGVTEPVISDERYRQFLKFKILKNTNNCTYYDVMKSIEILWKTKYIKYREDPSRPATILIDMQAWDIDYDMEQLERKSLAIKPAGVSLIYVVAYVVILDNTALERIECNKLKFYYELPFYLIRFWDGSWLLDGSVLLDAKRNFETGFGIISSGINVRVRELFGNDALAIHFQEVLPETFKGSGMHICTVIEEEKGMECASKVSILQNVDEAFGEAEVIMKKNLWYMDGTCLLDGSRLFNAEKWKESI